MHLPDGFLSPPVWASLDLLGAGAVSWCLARLRRADSAALVPRMGMLGAFVFAAQMVNVPVAAGTSGHLLGGLLVSALVGPVAASVVLACVFGIQCLLFQDGGILALGANFVNMGLVGAWGGYALLRGLARVLSRDVALFVASWTSVVATSALVSVELAASATVPLAPALAAMVSVHAVVGVLEGAITVAVARFLGRVRPDLLAGTALER
jgi:cobalt/nickel transport system permease protein